MKAQLRNLPLAQRREVLDEVRAHLEQEAGRRRRQDRNLSGDEAVLAATHAFGDPADIGVASGGSGAVVRRSTGEVLLHAAVLTGRGVARTVRTTLKWTLVTGGDLLLAVVVVGLTRLIAYRDTISRGIAEESGATIVYDYRASFGPTEPQATQRTDSFHFPPDARYVTLTISIAPNTGCLAIQVTDPAGVVVYQNGPGCSKTAQELTLGSPGTYKVQYAFAGFTGVVGVQARERT